MTGLKARSDDKRRRSRPSSRRHDANRRRGKHLPPAELVVPLGADAASAAELYARRTGRSLAPLCLSNDQIDVASCAVVLATLPNITTELLETLYPSENCNASPGLIFASSESELLTVAAGIADRVKGPDGGEAIIEIFATLQVGVQQVAERRILGDNAGADTIREAVTSPASILSLVTHSNGYDLYLGAGLSLCDAVEARGRSRAGAPCCEITGDCFRQHLRRVDASASGLVISPQQIRARILILYTCLGILGSAESREWGYVHALLKNRSVAAVVIGWSLLLPSKDDLQLLLGTLYSGATVGTAVAAVNRRDPFARLAVLGDPNAALSKLPSEHQLVFGFPEPAATIRGDAGRFLHMLCHAIADDSAGAMRTMAEVAATKVREYEYTCGLGWQHNDDFAKSMRSAVLAVLCDVGHLISHHWLPLTYMHERTPTARCDGCGFSAEIQHYSFRLPGVPPRELCLCTRCGIRRDMPVGRRLRLSLAGDVLTLDGDLPDQNWSAMARVGCQARELSAAFDWPIDASGAPCRFFKLPRPWPPGPLIIALLLIVDAELSIVTTLATDT